MDTGGRANQNPNQQQHGRPTIGSSQGLPLRDASRSAAAHAINPVPSGRNIPTSAQGLAMNAPGVPPFARPHMSFGSVGTSPPAPMHQKRPSPTTGFGQREAHSYDDSLAGPTTSGERDSAHRSTHMSGHSFSSHTSAPHGGVRASTPQTSSSSGGVAGQSAVLGRGGANMRRGSNTGALPQQTVGGGLGGVLGGLVSVTSSLGSDGARNAPSARSLIGHGGPDDERSTENVHFPNVGMQGRPTHSPRLLPVDGHPTPNHQDLSLLSNQVQCQLTRDASSLGSDGARNASSARLLIGHGGPDDERSTENVHFPNVGMQGRPTHSPRLLPGDGHPIPNHQDLSLLSNQVQCQLTRDGSVSSAHAIGRQTVSGEPSPSLLASSNMAALESNRIGSALDDARTSGAALSLDEMSSQGSRSGQGGGNLGGGPLPLTNSVSGSAGTTFKACSAAGLGRQSSQAQVDGAPQNHKDNQVIASHAAKQQRQGKQPIAVQARASGAMTGVYPQQPAQSQASARPMQHTFQQVQPQNHSALMRGAQKRGASSSQHHMHGDGPLAKRQSSFGGEQNFQSTQSHPFHRTNQSHQSPPDIRGGATHRMQPKLVPPPSQAPAAAQMRELKVEDALHYLDQVKMEFGDRPRIYNEFLEIMKNFKSQQIDTPGVIARVSHLFQGYNNLILGFNTFLPEGYKIELKDLEPGGFIAVSQAHQYGRQGPPSAPSEGLPGPGAAREYGATVPLYGPHGGLPHHSETPLQPLSQQQGATGGVSNIQMQLLPEQRQGIQQVGAQSQKFSEQRGMQVRGPAEFQVLSQQQQLHQQLRDRQNHPQPSPQLQNHLSSNPQLHQGQHSLQTKSSASAANQEQSTSPSVPGRAGVSHVPHGRPQMHSLQQQSSNPGFQDDNPQELRGSTATLGGPGGGSSYAPVEFDHAISYVTTIKKRFTNHPTIYQQFLEILHTYQKEQRGIKEVLEQVSELFADHPDLLKEFTYFLPDAVQEQAKERLHRAAMEGEMRLKLNQSNSGTREPPEEAYCAADTLPEGLKEAPLQKKRLPRKDYEEGMEIERGSRSIALCTDEGDESSTVCGPTPTLKPGEESFKLIDITNPQKEGFMSEENSETASMLSSQRTDKLSAKSSIAGGTRRSPTVVPSSQVLLNSSAPVVYLPQPEAYIYNAAVERQFFDNLKEALTSHTRDGGVAWAEFLKCLDLYAQEVLSRQEMLGFVEDLLGKRNHDLFEEFKRLLAAAADSSASTPSASSALSDDTWHSVPLSEIDFTRCRRCSPSYRALPRDYPAPPCSERSLDELTVLNDTWVSLPVGSEESYTFRHMRRNQHEENLFRCEDERFEIDMVIDTNASTLRRLEVIAEEMSMLGKAEIASVGLSDAPDDKSRLGAAGAGGKRFQYSIDNRSLSTIHKFSIIRIYGDSGQAMLKLIFKNPSKAVPVVVKRLRQKDGEWRAARALLNRRWKDVAEQNYHRSLDHRSLTWRTIDKRATSTRTLAAEIKDRSANNGREGESALAAKREKAKEEYGTFYEVTMGKSIRTRMEVAAFSRPTKSLFTPHLSLSYDNNSWVQLDAYRILSFALERGSNISPADKERGHRLLRTFVGPFFGLSASMMYSSVLSPSSLSISLMRGNRAMTASCSEAENEAGVRADIGSGDVESGLSHVVDSETSMLDDQPIPDGALVATLFGEGVVVSHRSAEKVYVVELSFGIAYVNPSAVLFSISPTPRSKLTDELRTGDKEVLAKGDMLVLGTQCLYLFFRLHHVLVRRLNIAKDLACKVSAGEKFTPIENIDPVDKLSCLDGKRRYEAYLSLLYALVEGGSSAAEGGRYEDRVRSLLGHFAYELATMDKLVSHLLKNLQSIGSDETQYSLIQVFRRHFEDGSFKPTAYRQEASHLSDGENIFAFQYCRSPATDRSTMHCEYLGCISGTEDEEEEEVCLRGTDRSCDEKMAEAEEEACRAQPTSKRQKRL